MMRYEQNRKRIADAWTRMDAVVGGPLKVPELTDSPEYAAAYGNLNRLRQERLRDDLQVLRAAELTQHQPVAERRAKPTAGTRRG